MACLFVVRVSMSSHDLSNTDAQLSICTPPSAVQDAFIGRMNSTLQSNGGELTAIDLGRDRAQAIIQQATGGTSPPSPLRDAIQKVHHKHANLKSDQIRASSIVVEQYAESEWPASGKHEEMAFAMPPGNLDLEDQAENGAVMGMIKNLRRLATAKQGRADAKAKCNAVMKRIQEVHTNSNHETTLV